MRQPIKKKKSNINSSASKTALVIISNIIIICLVIFLGNQLYYEGDNIQVKAEELRREVASPVSYPEVDPNLDTPSEALSEVNSQLNQMTYGGIQLIDGNDAENYTINFYIDYEMGGILYWEIGDTNIYSKLNAVTGEIIFYFHAGWTPGSLTQSEIAYLVPSIANQFHTLPQDSDGPYIDYQPDYFTLVGVDPETDDETTTIWDFWYIEYHRKKESVRCADNITLTLDSSGYLRCYMKIWNMDLSQFSVSTQYHEVDAELTALAYFSGSQLRGSHQTSKWIVRPNFFWEVPESPLDSEGNATMAYGLDPVVVWVVALDDSDGNICFVWVDGNSNKIVGGTAIMVESTF